MFDRDAIPSCAMPSRRLMSASVGTRGDVSWPPLRTALRCADVWDVDSWTTEPRRSYRLNSLFHRQDGAVITASGRLDGPAAAADLGAVLRPFERLRCAVVVDVSHAVLGARAVRALVEIGLRHSATAGGSSFEIAHADLGTRRRLEGAGGGRLVRPPCDRCPRAPGGAWARTPRPRGTVTVA